MIHKQGEYGVNLFLRVQGTNPLDAVEQYSLAMITNGVNGYAFRVVDPDDKTWYVIGSDVMSPAEFEAAYLVPSMEPEPLIPAAIDHDLPVAATTTESVEFTSTVE